MKTTQVNLKCDLCVECQSFTSDQEAMEQGWVFLSISRHPTGQVKHICRSCSRIIASKHKTAELGGTNVV